MALPPTTLERAIFITATNYTYQITFTASQAHLPTRDPTTGLSLDFSDSSQLTKDTNLDWTN